MVRSTNQTAGRPPAHEIGGSVPTNSAQATIEIGTPYVANLSLQPKFKSEFLDQTPFLRDGQQRNEWAGTGILMLTYPLLKKTLLEGGMEFTAFKDLVVDEGELLREGPAQPTGDFYNLVLAVQWSNVGEYLGYKLTTQFGFSFTKRWSETIELGDDRLVKRNEAEAFGTSFVTVYAGVK